MRPKSRKYGQGSSLRRALYLMVMLCLLVSCRQSNPYYFDGYITENALKMYLSRAVTMSEFLTVDPFCNDGRYPDKDADIDFIRESGAKFIGRSIYRWGDEKALNDSLFWAGARNLMGKVHAFDPDVIFQAAIFEAVYRDGVNSIRIPEWTFGLFGLPAEDRNFDYASMLFTDGSYVDMWGEGGSVPDITRMETQLWYAFLVGTYINAGIEAVHLGQVHLTGKYDQGWKIWDSFLDRMRAYAGENARRHFVLFDAHAGISGMMVGKRSLIDFNSYPLRIKEVIDRPMEGMLETGHFDSLYGKSKGCVTPSGWRCSSLPYIVEFDNFGYREGYGNPNWNDHYVWGYDEITWFYLQSDEYRKQWLEYAYNWLKKNDGNGFLQMPGARVVTIPGEESFMARAVDKTSSVPYGMGISGIVAELWNH